MGCYGLGVTRIIAACMECLSTDSNIRLPLLLAPFLLSVVIPKVSDVKYLSNYYYNHFFKY